MKMATMCDEFGHAWSGSLSRGSHCHCGKETFGGNEGKVASLDARRPHIVIAAADLVFVVPEANLMEFVRGEREMPQAMLRQIVAEWLTLIPRQQETAKS